MLTDSEHIEANLIGELDLLHEIQQPPLGAYYLACSWIGRRLSERINAELHFRILTGRGKTPDRRRESSEPGVEFGSADIYAAFRSSVFAGLTEVFVMRPLITRSSDQSP